MKTPDLNPRSLFYFWYFDPVANACRRGVDSGAWIMYRLNRPGPANWRIVHVGDEYLHHFDGEYVAPARYPRKTASRKVS